VKADCERVDSPPISEDEALTRLAEAARPVTDVQTEPLDRCLGRVLARDRKADVDVPPADNSAMDGYACRHLDVPVPGTQLRVSQRIAAGDRPPRLEPGTAARIFTGACIPEGADTVVMQEDCRSGAKDGIDAVTIEASPRAGDHIRRRGEDIRAGETILGAGTRLRPQDIGIAASIGLAELPVYRSLKVAIFFTGSELCEPGIGLAPGKIYNSNRPMLAASLRALGCEVLDLGSIDDDRRLITATLELAAREADLVITSGGASVGEEDHIRAAIADAGRLDLWRIAIKPGKPLAFGCIGETPVLGLPGNPVSSFVTFSLYARFFILCCQGRKDTGRHSFHVRAGFAKARPSNRVEYQRARLQSDPAHRQSALTYPQQSSGVLRSTTWADGLVCIPAQSTVAPGDWVEYIPFTSLLW